MEGGGGGIFTWRVYKGEISEAGGRVKPKMKLNVGVKELVEQKHLNFQKIES